VVLPESVALGPDWHQDFKDQTPSMLGLETNPQFP
jgi:hypothetical protein